MQDRLVYLIYRVGELLARVLPLSACFVFGKMLGSLGWRVLPEMRALALRNLAMAFGEEKPAAALEKLGRESFALLAANLLCSLKLARLSHEELLRRVVFEIPPEAEARRHAPTPEGWVAAISHLGNWELYAQLRHFLPEYRLGAIYQPLRNRFIDAAVRKDRERFGVRLFDRRSAMMAAARFLREGGAVGVLCDQYAGESGVWTPLFGRLAATTPLTATLAIHGRVPIVPIAVYTIGLARWRVKVSPLIHPGERDPDEVTAELNLVLENQIRESPADWLWAHDRWKTPGDHFLLAGSVRGVALPSAGAALRPFRILVDAPGDFLACLASLRAVETIKAGRPDAHVTVRCAPELHALWKGAPGVDEIVEGTARDEAFDAVVDLREAAPEIAGRPPATRWDEDYYLRFAEAAGGVPL